MSDRINASHQYTNSIFYNHDMYILIQYRNNLSKSTGIIMINYYQLIDRNTLWAHYWNTVNHILKNTRGLRRFWEKRVMPLDILYAYLDDRVNCSPLFMLLVTIYIFIKSYAMQRTPQSFTCYAVLARQNSIFTLRPMAINFSNDEQPKVIIFFKRISSSNYSSTSCDYFLYEESCSVYFFFRHQLSL